MIAELAGNQREIQSDIKRILENQQQWMEHCDECSKCYTSEINALKQTTAKNGHRIGTIEKVGTILFTIFTIVLAWALKFIPLGNAQQP